MDCHTPVTVHADFLFLLQFPDNAALALNICEFLEQNGTVLRIQRDQRISTVHLEEAASVQQENAKLSHLHALGVLHQQDISAVILGLHTVTADTQGIVRLGGLFVVGI